MAYQQFTPEELATEEWRDVRGFSFQIGPKTVVYQVSSLGRARSFYTHILKPSPRSKRSEYPTVSLYDQLDKTFSRKNIHSGLVEVSDAVTHSHFRGTCARSKNRSRIRYDYGRVGNRR